MDRKEKNKRSQQNSRTSNVPTRPMFFFSRRCVCVAHLVRGARLLFFSLVDLFLVVCRTRLWFHCCVSSRQIFARTPPEAEPRFLNFSLSFHFHFLLLCPVVLPSFTGFRPIIFWRLTLATAFGCPGDYPVGSSCARGYLVLLGFFLVILLFSCQPS